MSDYRMVTALRTAAAAACIAMACVVAPGCYPPATAASGVYGDPEAAAKYWVQQSLEDTCGLASVADVVGEITGNAPTEQQIIKLAQHTPSVIRDGPIYAPTGDPAHEGENGGIDLADTVVLLNHYGVKSHMTYDKHPEEVGLPKLEEYLGANRKIIAWVNGGTILDSSDQRTSPDHLLVVTGIDTNNEKVHLNDPYADHGNTKVSFTRFMTAWKIGQESIVVTS